MKWLSAVVVSAALVSSPALVSRAHAASAATSAQQSLRTVQRLETVTHKALHAYFMFVIQERAPLQQKKMNELLVQGDALVSQLDNGDVRTRWSEFRQALASDPYKDGDVAQVVLYAAEDQSALVVSALRASASGMRTAARIPVSKDADSLFELSTLMEQLTTIYLRNTADPLGGSNYSGYNRQLDPASLAAKFSQMLSQSRAAYSKNAAISSDLSQVFQKWNFIHGRMTDFNQKTVPFIVEKYNEQITQRLTEAYEKALK